MQILLRIDLDILFQMQVVLLFFLFDFVNVFFIKFVCLSGSGGGVSGGELGFLRHRALVEREGVRRARAVLRRRTDLLKQRRRSPAAWQVNIKSDNVTLVFYFLLVSIFPLGSLKLLI